MIMKRNFSDCQAELNMGAISCVLKIRRKDLTPDGFIRYKEAIIAAANRLIDVLEDEETTHKPQIQNF